MAVILKPHGMRELIGVNIDNLVKVNYKPVKSDVDTHDKMLQQIFSVDKLSGIPIGDLLMYMKKDCNPLLRDYIQNNLLLANSPERDSPVTDPVHDDFRFECARQSWESDNQYADRLAEIAEREKRDAEVQALRRKYSKKSDNKSEKA